MKISQAVAIRLNKILDDKKMSQYRLEKITATPHNTMKSLMSGKNSGVNLKTIMILIRGLNMTTAQFFDDPIFEDNDLDID